MKYMNELITIIRVFSEFLDFSIVLGLSVWAAQAVEDWASKHRMNE